VDHFAGGVPRHPPQLPAERALLPEVPLARGERRLLLVLRHRLGLIAAVAASGSAVLTISRTTVKLSSGGGASEAGTVPEMVRC
jgi:hypothetical protein